MSVDVEEAVSAQSNFRMPLWKRMLDVCLAMVAIPCLLPMFAIIALAIRATSKGNVFFTQERVGLHGAHFMMYKFRTMKTNAATTVHETYTEDLINSDRPMTKLDANDDRIIAFGRLFRATGIDELPQLFNVLRGDMSFVGPRPCLPSEYARYSEQQRQRFATPPGLTGLWQVSGKNRTTFREMIALDLEYVRTQSLWLDLKIIFKTIPALYHEASHFGISVAPNFSTLDGCEETPQPAKSGVELSCGSNQFTRSQ